MLMIMNHLGILEQLQKNIFLIEEKQKKIDRKLATIEEEIQKDIEYVVNKALKQKKIKTAHGKQAITSRIDREYLVNSQKRDLLQRKRILEELKQKLEKSKSTLI